MATGRELAPLNQRIDRFRGWLTSKADKIDAAAAGLIDRRQFVELVMRAVEGDTILLDCHPHSILLSLMHAAYLGLEVGLGEAHLVPFRVNKAGAKYPQSCQLILDYKGTVKLAYRNPRVLSVNAQVVYSNDLFEIDLAGQNVKHTPPLKGERGDMVGAYCIITLRDGGKLVEWADFDEIEKIRKSSRSGESPAWRNWPGEMARKCATKRAMKYAPRDDKMLRAMALEDKAEEHDLPTIGVPGEDVIIEDARAEGGDEEPPTKTDKLAKKVAGKHRELVQYPDAEPMTLDSFNEWRERRAKETGVPPLTMPENIIKAREAMGIESPTTDMKPYELGQVAAWLEDNVFKQGD